MRILRIGLLLGWRQIQRANKWTTLLIIFVMMLTFLNLIAVSGVLVGLITGAENAVRAEYLGDLTLTERDGEDHILDTETILREIPYFPEISAYSVRYSGAGIIEANYKERRDLKGERDTASVSVTGIDPTLENNMSGLASNIIDGEYLDPNEEGYILIGYYYLAEAAIKFGDIFDSVDNVKPGSTIRLTVGDVSKEFIVKGIVQSKVDQVSLNTYIPEREFRRLFDRVDRNADQIVVRMQPNQSEADLKETFIASGFEKYAKIKTYDEGKPKFITDIKDTFNTLGTFIGSIGIVVASITIFIIIFINALSRRQQIGILKGIGIERRAIEVAYVFQSAIYALLGSFFGALLTYAFLVPYFAVNPIVFPFSDGILVAPVYETFIRFVVLFIITLIAGFLPAWMIVKQNTLNSILGRK
ncbi:FtsX-like permease family protein [Candidatus Nomurabacteria bacterium]|nr:FtsX-like permease family protein [Candidatus Kaiserbacteria bacterium]MCB9815711.1 FtsX-like permease family protein [Candidatus Nomurabacteria bacterium]